MQKTQHSLSDRTAATQGQGGGVAHVDPTHAPKGILIPEGDFASKQFDTSHPAQPEQLILIYSTPRSGSTMLCDLIQRAGLCTAHEYFQPYQYRPALEERWNVAPDDDEAFAQALKRHRIGAHGHLGINLHASHLPEWKRAEPYFADFKKVTRLHIYRRDQAAQAVSYYLASKTGNWSVAFETAKETPVFDRKEIDKYRDRLIQSEAELKAHFQSLDTEVISLAYEDLAKDDQLLLKHLPQVQDELAPRQIHRQSGAINKLYRRVYAHPPAKRSLLSRSSKLPAVTVVPHAKGNPYQGMLYSSFENICDVRLHRKLKPRQFGFFGKPMGLLHVHWEEGVLWGASSVEDSKQRSDAFKKIVSEHKSQGGKLAWTLHNAASQAGGEWDEIESDLRAFMVANADVVHVHSKVARDFARDSIGVPENRICIVAHPSYVGRYPEASTVRRPKEAGRARFLYFGRMKVYKGPEELAHAFSNPQVVACTDRLTIAGMCEEEVAAALKEGLAPLGDKADLKLEHIPNEEVHDLFQDADFVLLPYRHALTSGVAALAMTFGVPIVAPRIGGMIEAIPQQNSALLFSDNETLDDAIQRAAQITTIEHKKMIEHAEEMARQLAPRAQSAKLLNEFADRGLIPLDQTAA